MPRRAGPYYDTGVVTATLRSDPWGIPGTSSGATLPEFRFQGSWYDTSAGLSWVVSRWYAPSLGQFISEDGLLGQPQDPASRHLYAYAEGDPIGGWDQDGHESQRWFSLQNRAHFHGTLVLSAFIAAAYNNVLLDPHGFGFVKLYGDNRGFASWMPSYSRSRFIMKLYFNSLGAYVQVHDTCGEIIPWIAGCTTAFPVVTSPLMTYYCGGVYWPTCSWIPDNNYNLVKINESLGGVIHVQWSITQSMLPIFRPSLTVDGYMYIYPGTLFWDERARIKYYADNFPSQELYWFNNCTRTGCLTRKTVFQRPEGPYTDMDPSSAWGRTYFLP